MKSWKDRKQVILNLMKDDFYVPMKEKELAIMLQTDPEDRPQLKRALEELLAEGSIQISKRGKYTLSDPGSGKGGREVLRGTFIGHAKGFGFVEAEGDKEDLYIPEDKVNGALHLDEVEVVLLPSRSGRRQEAAVTKILKRGTETLVGTFQKSRHYGFVIPDNARLPFDVFIPEEDCHGAAEGHKVVVKLTDYGGSKEGMPGRNPQGVVLEILGHIHDPGVDILSIVRGYDLPTEFPEKVMRQAERIPDRVSEADRMGRSDLRQLTMVTIDGEDARDLDDAVSLEKEGELYHLGVHIADVANYVQENSALDREALKRGTSVYLADRVIPMLPHRLSNGICSLNAGVDRLAVSCLMTIDSKGEVLDYRLEETVICVRQRMTYTAVKKILEGDPREREGHGELIPMLEQMRDLAAILHKKRRKRGSIDFDFPETRLRLDEMGRPLEILPYERNLATGIIEEFMLIANETVAQHFYWLELPFVYRTHEVPEQEKMEKLASFIYTLGYPMKVRSKEIHPKEIQKLLGRIEGTPEEALISRLTLRSMKQAKYTVQQGAHFGLACEHYCHFTSPIRRYPDLLIHRIVKDWLRGRLHRMERYESFLPEAASASSRLERRAAEAERETIKLKKAEYMEAHLGEEYEGVISGVTQWGIYVELPNTVEGMVHVSRLPGDYFYYEEASHEMVGTHTDIRYKLGQTIRVMVAGADRGLRTVDFVIA
ncbi:MAG: ribonuclease R [Lachnospiraceae bacterium]|nr:ribonuclease R [Lachnospiraceae bacterium]